jgi:hypothetical protein
VKKLLPIVAFFFNVHALKESQTNHLVNPASLDEQFLFYQKNNKIPGVDWPKQHFKTLLSLIRQLVESENGDYFDHVVHAPPIALDRNSGIKSIRRYVRLAPDLAKKPKTQAPMMPAPCAQTVYTDACRVDPVMNIVIPPVVPPFMPLLSPWFMALAKSKNTDHDTEHSTHDTGHDEPPNNPVVSQPANEVEVKPKNVEISQPRDLGIEQVTNGVIAPTNHVVLQPANEVVVRPKNDLIEPNNDVVLEPKNALSNENSSKSTLVVVSQQDSSVTPEQDSSVRRVQYNSPVPLAFHHVVSQPGTQADAQDQAAAAQVQAAAALLDKAAADAAAQAAQDQAQAARVQAAQALLDKAAADAAAQAAQAQAARVQAAAADAAAERAKADAHYEGIGKMFDETKATEKAKPEPEKLADQEQVGEQNAGEQEEEPQQSPVLKKQGSSVKTWKTEPVRCESLEFLGQKGEQQSGGYYDQSSENSHFENLKSVGEFNGDHVKSAIGSAVQAPGLSFKEYPIGKKQWDKKQTKEDLFKTAVKKTAKNTLAAAEKEACETTNYKKIICEGFNGDIAQEINRFIEKEEKFLENSTELMFFENNILTQDSKFEEAMTEKRKELMFFKESILNRVSKFEEGIQDCIKDFAQENKSAVEEKYRECRVQIEKKLEVDAEALLTKHCIKICNSFKDEIIKKIECFIEKEEEFLENSTELMFFENNILTQYSKFDEAMNKKRKELVFFEKSILTQKANFEEYIQDCIKDFAQENKSAVEETCSAYRLKISVFLEQNSKSMRRKQTPDNVIITSKNMPSNQVQKKPTFWSFVTDLFGGCCTTPCHTVQNRETTAVGKKPINNHKKKMLFETDEYNKEKLLLIADYDTAVGNKPIKNLKKEMLVETGEYNKEKLLSHYDHGKGVLSPLEREKEHGERLYSDDSD